MIIIISYYDDSTVSAGISIFHTHVQFQPAEAIIKQALNLPITMLIMSDELCYADWQSFLHQITTMMICHLNALRPCCLRSSHTFVWKSLELIWFCTVSTKIKSKLRSSKSQSHSFAKSCLQNVVQLSALQACFCKEGSRSCGLSYSSGL